MSEETRYQERGTPHKVEFPVSVEYESVEFNVANGTTDYNVSTQQANAFNTLKRWTSASLRTNKAISIKINSTDNPSISISKYESPFHLKYEIEIANIFITNNSGATAAIKLVGFHRSKDHV